MGSQIGCFSYEDQSQPDVSNKYCPKCGRVSYDSEATFCMDCGERLVMLMRIVDGKVYLGTTNNLDPNLSATSNITEVEGMNTGLPDHVIKENTSRMSLRTQMFVNNANKQIKADRPSSSEGRPNAHPDLRIQAAEYSEIRRKIVQMKSDMNLEYDSNDYNPNNSHLGENRFESVRDTPLEIAPAGNTSSYSELNVPTGMTDRRETSYQMDPAFLAKYRKESDVGLLSHQDTQMDIFNLGSDFLGQAHEQAVRRGTVADDDVVDYDADLNMNYDSIRSSSSDLPPVSMQDTVKQAYEFGPQFGKIMGQTRESVEDDPTREDSDEENEREIAAQLAAMRAEKAKLERTLSQV